MEGTSGCDPASQAIQDTQARSWTDFDEGKFPECPSIFYF